MSLRFILGGSRTGKSYRLDHLIMERVQADPDARILLIVPSQYTLSTQKRLVGRFPGHAVMNVDIVSFERLAYRIFDETGTSTREILDETGKAMILRHVLEEKKDELSIFRGRVRSSGFVDKLSAMISELIEYDISPQALRERMPSVGADTRLYMKLQDIHTLYSGFMEFIQGKYMTSQELLDLLCDALPKSANIHSTAVFMDNYTGFTPVQYKVIEQLLLLAPELTMTLCTEVESYPFAQPDPDSLFSITQETFARLDGMCRAGHIAREEDILLRKRPVKSREESSEKADLHALEQQIFRSNPRVYEGVPENIHICRAGDIDEEMRFAAAKIHELVRDRGLHYSQIAVVTGDMESCVRPAGRWFRRYGIPCFFDMRVSVAGNMLVEWMRALMRMLRRNFTYESVFRYLRSGLCVLEREEIDVLENYAIAYNIRGRSKWFRPFTAGSGERELGSQKVEELNAIREKLAFTLEPVRPLAGTKKRTAGEMVKNIYECMRRTGIRARVDDRVKEFETEGDLDRAKQYGQIYDVMISILERIFMILGDVEMNMQDFTEVLESGIRQIRLGVIPPGIDQVTFGDLRRSRLDDVKVVLFAGVNDGIVPKMGTPSGLINDAERERLENCSIRLAPTARENLRTERFYQYSCMTKPEDTLILSWSARDGNGEEKLPAGLIRQLQSIFPGLQEEDAGACLKPDVILAWETVREGFARMSDGGRRLADRDADRRFRDACSWLMQSEKYQARVRLLADAAGYVYRGDRLTKQAVDALYGGRLRGGVTMLEEYQRCAFAHFLRYGLKLKEREVYEVQAPDLGSILHAVIEAYSRRAAGSGRGWLGVDEKTCGEWVDQAVLSVVSDYRSNMMQDSGRARYLTQWLCGTAKRTVWALTEQLRKGDFRPEDYEYVFDMAIPGAERMNLHGRIDRIDTCVDGDQLYLRIIDYKTGKDNFDLQAACDGLRMQLPVYMNAAVRIKEAEQGRRRDGQPLHIVPAGIFYYRMDDPMLETTDLAEFAGIAADAQETDFELLDSLAMKGFMVSDEDVVRHMDHAPAGEPKVLPIHFKKDGQLDARSRPYAADREHFDLLMRYTDIRCAEIGRQILGCRIDVHPWKSGKETGCDYCEFKPVCGFSRGIEGYSYRNIPKMDVDMIWQKIAEKISEYGMRKGGGQDGDPVE